MNNREGLPEIFRQLLLEGQITPTIRGKELDILETNLHVYGMPVRIP